MADLLSENLTLRIAREACSFIADRRMMPLAPPLVRAAWAGFQSSLCVPSAAEQLPLLEFQNARFWETNYV